MRSRTRRAAVLLPLLIAPAAAPAQTPRTIDVFDYVLDVDPPESAALVAMHGEPFRVFRASAPKPVVATLASWSGPEGWTRAGAVDVSPYWLAGGGLRPLESYRRMTAGGRMARVFTKTVLSAAAADDPADPGALRVGFGVRQTLHDPHDPIGTTRLPEEVAAARAANPAADLRPLHAAARREVRARCCQQISWGWGVSGRLAGAAARADSLEGLRHAVWLSNHFTPGSRLDVLTTVGAADAFGRPRLRAGAAVQRKGDEVDVVAELAYDGVDRRLHPGIGAEFRPLPALRVSAVLGTHPAAAPGAPPARLRLHAGARWFLAVPDR